MTERDNKVAVITGASRGIGDALVNAYRVRGYSVVATSRSIRPATDPEILTVAGDISEPETAQRVIDAALERFGRIDTSLPAGCPGSAGVRLDAEFVPPIVPRGRRATPSACGAPRPSPTEPGLGYGRERSTARRTR
jgi:short-subunit dehydrogenase involved in D-alanine esterification of teichoic acids